MTVVPLPRERMLTIGISGQFIDPTPTYTRVLFDALGQVEPPIMLSWPEARVAPIAMITCPTCGLRQGRRATGWEHDGSSRAQQLQRSRFHCWRATGGCDATFSQRWLNMVPSRYWGSTS